MSEDKAPQPAGNEKPRLGHPGQVQQVETQVGDGMSASLDLGTTGLAPGENQHKVQNDTEGLSVEIGVDNLSVREENHGTTKKDDPHEDDDTSGKPKEPVEGAAPEALPEFDAAKPETVEAYGKRYLEPTGAPDFSKLSADWTPTMDAQGNVTGGSLPEGTYAFLASKGFSKETVKAIEAGQVAIAKDRANGIFKAAGSEADYRAAQAWAKANYTPAQREKFNKDINGSDSVAQSDAVDLMMTRFRAAVPKERRLAPVRSVADNAGSGSQGSSGAAPYANHAEWQKEHRKAMETNDQALYNLSRKRLAVSPWYGK